MKHLLSQLAAPALVVTIASALAACATRNDASPGLVSSPPAATGSAASPAQDEISGSQAWSRNCAQCHNSISPNTYSDQQWDAVVMHMRIHARLTGAEERAILKFLKASN